MNTKKSSNFVETEVSLSVTFNTTPWEFKALIHCAKSDDELKLQTDDFYMKFRSNNDLPSFPHHEVQLLNLESELQYAKRIWNNEEQIIPLHIHYSDKPDRHPFMCWPGDLPTEKDAIASWELWCLGSIWSLRQFWNYNEKIGFEILLQELGWNTKKFIAKLRNDGIRITQRSY